MNVLGILGYALVLLALRVAVGFVVAGFHLSNEVDSQLVLSYAVAYTADAFVVIAVIATLAKRQPQATLSTVLLVVVLQWVLGVGLSNAIGWHGEPSPLWLVDGAILLTAAILGAWIGKRAGRALG